VELQIVEKRKCLACNAGVGKFRQANTGKIVDCLRCNGTGFYDQILVVAKTEEKDEHEQVSEPKLPLRWCCL